MWCSRKKILHFTKLCWKISNISNEYNSGCATNMIIRTSERLRTTRVFVGRCFLLQDFATSSEIRFIMQHVEKLSSFENEAKRRVSAEGQNELQGIGKSPQFKKVLKFCCYLVCGFRNVWVPLKSEVYISLSVLVCDFHFTNVPTLSDEKALAE